MGFAISGVPQCFGSKKMILGSSTATGAHYVPHISHIDYVGLTPNASGEFSVTISTSGAFTPAGVAGQTFDTLVIGY